MFFERQIAMTNSPPKTLDDWLVLAQASGASIKCRKIASFNKFHYVDVVYHVSLPSLNVT